MRSEGSWRTTKNTLFYSIFFCCRIAIHIQYSSFVFMHFFRRKKVLKRTKKTRSLCTNGLKNLLKNHYFSFQNHVFPQEKSRQKASSTLPESIFPELFFQVKKSRKNNEKHNALIRLLRKNHVKTLFFS